MPASQCSSVLTPPKTPLLCNKNISSSSIKRALDATFEETKRSKTDYIPNKDTPNEYIPDEDLLAFANNIVTNESNNNVKKQNQTKTGESKDHESPETHPDHPAKIDEPEEN